MYGKKAAVDHVSLTFAPGHIYAMLGPNGSGKTTWMKMAAGLVKPTSGEMYFEGHPLCVADRASITYMSTEPYFYNWMTIRHVGKYFQDFFADFSRDEWNRLLENMELTEDLRIKELSTGMMAKLKIAAALSRDSKVIMLDEPLNGIDLLARDQIAAGIRRSAGPNKIMLISSHLVEELEQIADVAVFMKTGKLVETVTLDELHNSWSTSVADRYREIYRHGGENA